MCSLSHSGGETRGRLQYADFVSHVSPDDGNQSEATDYPEQMI